MVRWTCLVILALPLISGCHTRTTTSAPPERPGLFTIDTDLGPVDVLAFEQDGGKRSIRLHAVYPDGHHAVRTVHVDVANPATGAGVVESVWGEGTERLRITRNLTEQDGGLDATYAAGDETLRLVVFAQGTDIRFQATLNRNGTERVWDETLDPARASEASYVASMRASFADFYGAGPFRQNEDLSLLIAVEESQDWSNHLAEVPFGPEGGQNPTERNIHRVCTAAGVIGKISCFASRFTPWAMIACVPATGISLACLAYNVYEATASGHPDPPNPCTCGCQCSHGD